MAREWDFFISHASEDKEAVARPLAKELIRAGFRVWLDIFELKAGDSLRARIDEGLAHSRFGIVILSPRFFAKRWTSAELGALFALDDEDGPRIIPVWHDVEYTDVAKLSPLLADKIAHRMRGVSQLARDIVDQLRDRLDLPQTIQRELVSLLERGVVADVAAFLARHPHQLAHAAALTEFQWLKITLRPKHFRSDVQARDPEWTPDLILEAANSPSLGGTSRCVITLGPIPARPAPGKEADEIQELVSATERYVERLDGRRGNREVRGIVAVGRRATRADIAGRPRTDVRSYDWLVDAFLQASVPSTVFAPPVIVETASTLTVIVESH